jgi:DNA-binding response OmpR family regulator
MNNPSLSGRLILVCEDEALISLDIADAFKRAGARVVVTPLQREAAAVVEASDLSAAVLDHSLRDGDCSELCALLKERNIPFVIHSGFDRLDDELGAAVYVSKPASTDVLVTTVAGLLQRGATV